MKLVNTVIRIFYLYTMKKNRFSLIYEIIIKPRTEIYPSGFIHDSDKQSLFLEITETDIFLELKKHL